MAKPLYATDTAQAVNLLDLVGIVERGTVSKTLLNEPLFKQVVFAMDAGQELTEHRAPYLALVQVLDGRLRISVAGQEHQLVPTSWLLMPPDAPHDVHAETPSRFLLTLVRASSGESR
ncbi:MAG: cupin domain-containing protein [Phycisphaerales bacterium]|nr:cupin domain-containing protein [Phycisphaerales bacterium]